MENAFAPRTRCLYGSRMTAEEVKSWPMAQKMRVMEVLWQDLRERFEHAEASPQLQELLDRRRSRVRAGATEILDWDSVKSSIGRA